MKVTKPYSILVHAIDDAIPLIKQGSGEQAHELLAGALQQTEEIFVSSPDDQVKDNLAEELGVSMEYMRNLLCQQIIFQDGLDSPISNFLILEKYEDEPFYELLCETYKKAFLTAFKLGFDVRDLMARQSIALSYKTIESGKVQLEFTTSNVDFD